MTFVETAPTADVALWSTPLSLFPNIGKVPSIWQFSTSPVSSSTTFRRGSGVRQRAVYVGSDRTGFRNDRARGRRTAMDRGCSGPDSGSARAGLAGGALRNYWIRDELTPLRNLCRLVACS